MWALILSFCAEAANDCIASPRGLITRSWSAEASSSLLSQHVINTGNDSSTYTSFLTITSQQQHRLVTINRSGRELIVRWDEVVVMHQQHFEEPIMSTVTFYLYLKAEASEQLSQTLLVSVLIICTLKTIKPLLWLTTLSHTNNGTHNSSLTIQTLHLCHLYVCILESVLRDS